MDYRRFNQTLVVRIDRGEEILEQIRAVALKEQIRLASISALGAVSEFTIGVFDTEKKQYFSNSFSGVYEIVSLTGTLSTMNGESYTHVHMCAGNDRGEAFGGHLNRAVVSATCEMVITVIDGAVDRRFDETVGLNLFSF